MEQARKEGIRAGLAPLGYLNVTDKQGNKDVIPDPDQRHLIVKMFELYATGKYSYREITESMKKLGLKSKQGQPVGHSKIADALKDTFYYGMMKSKGEIYPHRHEPIISYELFQRAQEVREGHNKKPFQYMARLMGHFLIENLRNTKIASLPFSKKWRGMPREMKASMSLPIWCLV